MSLNRRGAAPFIAIVVVLGITSTATAQTTPARVQSPSGHSVWRDVLIGTAVGTGAGLMIGKMRNNFHNAECRVLDCHRVLEMDTLGPLGAVTGAAVGFLVHHVRQHGSEARPSLTLPVSTSAGRNRRSPIFTPSISRTRQAILFRTEF